MEHYNLHTDGTTPSFRKLDEINTKSVLEAALDRLEMQFDRFEATMDAGLDRMEAQLDRLRRWMIIDLVGMTILTGALLAMAVASIGQ